MAGKVSDYLPSRSTARFTQMLPYTATPRPPAFWKEQNMYKALNGAIIAMGLVGATLAMAAPASAQDVGVGVHVGDVGIGIGLGNVAYGYQDGYWDNGHQWHTWQNDQQMRDYRKERNNHYNDWKHDRDPDQGWHS